MPRAVGAGEEQRRLCAEAIISPSGWQSFRLKKGPAVATEEEVRRASPRSCRGRDKGYDYREM